MSDFLVELKNFARHAQANSKHVQHEKMSSKVCLVSLKFDSENIETAKRLTTEGMKKQDRLNYLQTLTEHLGKEVFEFSTCNRILYVGFDIEPEELAAGVSTVSNIPIFLSNTQPVLMPGRIL